MNNATVLLPLQTEIVMKQTELDDQDYTGLYLTEQNGFVVPIYGPGIHLNEQDSTLGFSWIQGYLRANLNMA